MVLMIRHIVMFRFTDKVTKENRQEILNKLEESVYRMSGEIPGLKVMELKENKADSPYDIVMYSEFESKEAELEYQHHPLHIAHRDMAASYVCDRNVIEI